MLPIPKKNNKWKNYTIQFQTYYKATSDQESIGPGETTDI